MTVSLQDELDAVAGRTGFSGVVRVDRAGGAELAAGPVWRVSTLHRFLAAWERRPGRPSSETGG